MSGVRIPGGKKPGIGSDRLEEVREVMFNAVVMTPLSRLLAWILGGEPEEWDTLEELLDNLIPALMRLPIRILVEILDDIPIIGDAIEDSFAAWLRTTNRNATAASVTANAALALAQSAHSGGVANNETFLGSGALDAAKFTISASRVQKVSDNLGITTQTGDGIYQDWVVYKPEYTSDNQSAAIVLGSYGRTDRDTSLFIHCNSDCTRFVYLNIFNNRCYLGQGSRSGGSWTWNDWTNFDIDTNPGYSVALQNVGNLYTVTVNGNVVMNYPDTAATAPSGTAYRRMGIRMVQFRFFFTNARSYHVRALAMADV